MGRVCLPSWIGQRVVPNWDYAPHIQEMEMELLRLAAGQYRRLILSVPIRHGKSELVNLFIAWLLISQPRCKILRVMASADTARDKARDVLKYIERWGERLTGVKLDRRRCSAEHFCTEAGGSLRSVGAGGDVESWTFSHIIIDDIITDPFEIRNPNRREQIYRDMQTKFFSRVDPIANSKFLVIGSRRHPDDPIGRLLEADLSTKANDYDRWHYHHRPALFDEGTDHETCLWPTSREFTVEGLHKIRDQKITDGLGWEWNCNFQGDATASPDMLAFDSKWMLPENVLYDCPSEALPPAKFRVLSIDPSMGAGNEWNDYFAALYLHISDDSTIYVDDLWLAVAKPDVIVPCVAGLICRHPDVDVIPFESNAGGLYAAELIKASVEGQGGRFPAVFKMWGASDEKISRICLHLYEILQNGRLKIRDCPMGRALFRQLQQFPTAKLDGPDALTTGVAVLKEMLAGGHRH